MNNKRLKLAQRRERLIQESADQRARLAECVDVWREPLVVADKCILAAVYFKKHPVWLAAGSLVLFKLVRPSFVGKWISRGWVAWKLLRKL